jgi:hypothetical protein
MERVSFVVDINIRPSHITSRFIARDDSWAPRTARSSPVRRSDR